MSCWGLIARRGRAAHLFAVTALLGASFSPDSAHAAPRAPEISRSAALQRDFPNALVVARSRLDRTAAKPSPKAELLVLTREGGAWNARAVADPDSMVFHKAMVFGPPDRPPGILTIGGLGALIKLWRPRGANLVADEILWRARFGGEHDRIRDVEVGDVFGDGGSALAVATHDQGVVALVRPVAEGYEVTELDRAPNTWVHEIELGDLDGDGVLEVYATPSEPNRIGVAQAGEVVRFVPARREGRRVVATLAGRHAKEILVEDLDGDGRDELYVSVEAVSGGRVEIRRYLAHTAPDAGELVAELADAMCRFLVAGDLDGDGRKEVIVTGRDSGVWLARARADATWRLESIDRESGGFEHAALISDLDGDGRDELFVASDKHQELRRFVNAQGTLTREVVWKAGVGEHVMTWSLTAAPVALVRSAR